MSTRKIYVFECWTSERTSLMGCLYSETLRGKENCSFEYDTDWLKRHANQSFLDPDLQLFHGFLRRIDGGILCHQETKRIVR